MILGEFSYSACIPFIKYRYTSELSSVDELPYISIADDEKFI